MTDVQPTVWIAISAGILSFLSPCVLPLIPGFIAYLSGTSLQTEEGSPWWRTLLHALAFVCGFTVIFVALGASVSSISGLLFNYRPWIQRTGGLVIIVLGLHTAGLLRLPFLLQTTQISFAGRRQWGLLSSVLLGVVFSAGWTPCVGPILLSILMLAGQEQTAAQGAYLLAAYSLGLGVPFLLVGAAFGRLAGWLRRLNRHLHLVSVVSGLFLVAVGFLIFTDMLSILAAYGSFVELP
ncbi:MAG: cytochrome c biogenesis protein CcdA [Chloroflexi bacterium]|nr:cytochrome c biogenesis protein CcdA [Chloroflexota bacterium]